MLIELAPERGFERGWVNGGFEDFLDEARRWAQQHLDCGDRASPTHLSVEDKVDRAGVRRLWLYCACGHRRVVLGPEAGGDMAPLFPRVQ